MLKCLWILPFLLIVLSDLSIYSQDLYPSIHIEQNVFYSRFGEHEPSFYDSLNGHFNRNIAETSSDCQLHKIVFGFHPYWAGNDYLAYRWNMLSDLCYFSYEVNSSSGEPVTIHEWLSDPAIDSAQAHNTRVHLCATIFSGHTAFFTNPVSRQTLITNLVSLVQQRNADGINMDIEALPAALGDSVTSFMRDLSLQLKAAIPGAILSIDLPAVDWSGNFDIPGMDPYVDYFFVMGYDYYWNGSSQAGPVSPLYAMTSGYDYSLSRTISAYESTGMDRQKFILGVPYYGRQWMTQSNSIPSPVLANGVALTYANVRNNPGLYNPSICVWEPGSFSSCYIFFQNSAWNQCFIGLDRDLRKKYDIVNYRDLAGIGIWALGYDDGYAELWDAISDKFSDCCIPLLYDTIYDSGGPAWNYYANEDYILTVDHGFNDQRWLAFTGFSLEEGYDSLWLYAGPDTTFPFLGGFSGQTIPGAYVSDNGAFTIRFKSDGLQNAPGWSAVFHDGSLSAGDQSLTITGRVSIFPNPASNVVNIEIPGYATSFIIKVVDFSGRQVLTEALKINSGKYKLDISGLEPGTYFIILDAGDSMVEVQKFIKT